MIQGTCHVHRPSSNEINHLELILTHWHQTVKPRLVDRNLSPLSPLLSLTSSLLSRIEVQAPVRGWATRCGQSSASCAPPPDPIDLPELRPDRRRASIENRAARSVARAVARTSVDREHRSETGRRAGESTEDRKEDDGRGQKL